MVFGRRKKEAPKEQPVPVETPDLVVQTQPAPKHMGMPGFVPDIEPAAQPAPVQPLPTMSAAPIQEVVQKAVQAPAQPAPAPVQRPAPATIAAVAQPAPAPAPAPVQKDWFQIQAAEQIGEGTYRTIVVSNRPIGDIGGVYDL